MSRLLLRKVAAVRAGCRVEQHVDLKSRGGLVSSGPQWSAVVSQSDDIWSLLLSRFHCIPVHLSSLKLREKRSSEKWSAKVVTGGLY